MLSYRLTFTVMFMGVLLAGALHADKVNYIVGVGDKAQVKFEDKATVTSWNAAGVKFKVGDGKEVSVNYADIISIDRRGGTMSPELADALDFAGADPVAAAEELAAIAASGSDLDKQEAAIYRAQILDSESAADSSLVADAIAAYKAYVSSWKAGYFAREAYRGLAALQKVSDARATLGLMISADKALEREGNQLLGQLEASAAKWTEAISAFKKAQTAAGTDINNKYLAMAWEGWMTLKSGNSAGAKTLLETVTNDPNFDDPNTTIDENALGIAYPALGDLQYEAGAHQKAYDAYIKGAYYAWWTGGDLEGHCLGYAYMCAKKLEGTDTKWTARKDKLRTALALGFPRVLTEVEKE
jgi:tetratricopeptide (TPR) repeat protein